MVFLCPHMTLFHCVTGSALGREGGERLVLTELTPPAALVSSTFLECTKQGPAPEPLD